jgi:hypothetical protein
MRRGIFERLILLTVRGARKVFQCVSIKEQETLQGATVRTILLDDFMSLAIIVWVCLLVTTLGDVFARTDLCGWKKAVWAVAVLTLPMGAFAYMALQSRAITDRNTARLSPSDPQAAHSDNISDEIGEVDCLVPMIQHAIEITGILEAEGLGRAIAQPEQIGLCDRALSSEHALAREPIRSDPGDGDHQRFPAVAL